MGDSPEPAHGILLRVELVRARMRTWRANADDAGYVDLDDPNVYDTDDRRYLDPSHPKVQAHLERIRADAARTTSPGQPDDIDELRRRAGLV
jgi:hypothetical protein